MATTITEAEYKAAVAFAEALRLLIQEGTDGAESLPGLTLPPGSYPADSEHIANQMMQKLWIAMAQSLLLQPASELNPGIVSLVAQTLGLGRKTVEMLTTGSGSGSGSQALTVRSSGTSVNALAEFMQGAAAYGYVGMGTDNVMRMEVLSSRPLALKNGSDRITVNTSDMALAPNPLVGVTIDSDFSGYDANSTPRVVLEQSGRLTLTGGVKRNSGTIVSGEALLTTPSGYRPQTRNRYFTVQCYGGCVNITWQTDGVVVINTVGGVSASPHLGIWFDGVSFDPRA